MESLLGEMRTARKYALKSVRNKRVQSVNESAGYLVTRLLCYKLSDGNIRIHADDGIF